MDHPPARVIPFDLVGPRRGSHPVGLLERRKEIQQAFLDTLGRLRVTAESVRSLIPSETYYLRFPAATLRGLRDGSLDTVKDKATGEWLGSICDAKSRKIVKLPRLGLETEVFSHVLKGFVLQQALVQIAAKLDAVKDIVQHVLLGQIADRVGTIQSGVNLYEQARVCSDPGRRQQLLTHSIALLEQGRSQVITSVQTVLPLARRESSVLDRFNPFGGPVRHKNQLDDIVKPVFDSVPFALVASQHILLAYELSAELSAAEVSAKQFEARVAALGESPCELARMLPFDRASAPEDSWKQLQLVSKELPAALGSGNDIEIEIVGERLISSMRS